MATEGRRPRRRQLDGTGVGRSTSRSGVLEIPTRAKKYLFFHPFLFWTMFLFMSGNDLSELMKASIINHRGTTTGGRRSFF